MSIEKIKKINKLRKIIKNGEYIEKRYKGVVKIIKKIINWIYPPVCGMCGKLNINSLCNKCKIKLKGEFQFKIDNYEKDFSKNYIEHSYFFKYENIIRNQILALKFQEKPYIYQTITYFLENMQKSFEILKKYDIIIIVPISKQRKKDRGYNQSELIAREISKLLKIPIARKVLYKHKNIVPQSSLNREQREKNIKDAYKIKNAKKLYNKKILIFDDIYTTGNTVNECARVLTEAGVPRTNIGILTIAKD